MSSKTIKSKLKDWKLWIFGIFPLLLGAIAFTILIVFIKTKDYNVSGIIISAMLIVIEILLLITGTIIKYVKDGGKRNIIAAVLIAFLTLVLIAILLVCIARLPKIVTLQKERDVLWEEYLNTSYKDEELYTQRHEAYYDTKHKLDELKNPTEWMLQISSIIYAVSLLAIRCFVDRIFDNEDKSVSSAETEQQN